MNPNPPGGRPLHDRLLAYLKTPDGKKLIKGLVGMVLFLLAQRRVVALVAALSIGSGVVGANLAGSGSEPAKTPPIAQAWLATAGPYKVERLNVPCLDADVSRTVAPKGVAHTTEGGWASAISVFRRQYAPHFMVGRDNGRVRIVQFCPLGKAASALRNRAGGVETNRWARAQIEIVGFSSRTLWKPDPGVLQAYAALLYELRQAAGIPLRYVPNGSRNPTAWKDRPGWFAHAGVPENDHWDPGALDWTAVLNRASSFAPVVNPGHAKPPTPPPPRYRICYWKRGLPKAVCLDVRYASLRQLAVVAPKKPG